jgi:hypothetical protein
MNKKTIGLQITTSVALFAMAVIPAFAELNINAGGSIETPYTTTETRTTIASHGDNQKDHEIDRQDKGDGKIDLRLNSLHELEARINAMIHISGDNKSSLSAMIQSQIDALTNLKAKINADTDPAVLKADMKSITNSYRIFMLVEPKARITAAADRALELGTSFATLSTKLSANIATASSGGHDVTTLNTSLSDMNTNVAKANIQANAAIALVASLVPDNGNATVMASNKTALVNARADIKVANQDLKNAYADAKSIVQALKGFNISTNS